jgi:hypothetical protein
MAKSNKLETKQLEQINHLNEGLFSGIWVKLLGRSLKSKMKDFDKDPGMKSALDNLDRALDDTERAFEISFEQIWDYEKDGPLPKTKEARLKHLRKIGFKG